ncbi:MAG: LON peptidase substrate-binding domain-containing protein [Deltaproteobacteria bacterium]|nr:LON peptidase substrate-binding domain-containing protein [Deltaproteobacteria bacterium]
MSSGRPLSRTLARALRRLPLFPLEDVVLFPHSMIPLYVFEARYRKMVRDVLAGNRLLAISLQLEKEDPSGDSPPRVAAIASVGELVLAQELPDGRFNLVVRGRARIAIDEELPSDEPYRVVAAHEIPDDPPATLPDLAEADTALRALVTGLAESIPDGGDLLKHVAAAQETPAALANVMAASLVADARTRQRLLETTDVYERLEQLSGEVVALIDRVSKPGRAN